jgi:hypothetical protein
MVDAASKPNFRHHEWYVRYHLELVEQIAAELTLRHPEADTDLVRVLVWLHDYGKTLDTADEHEATLSAGRAQLHAVGFDPTFADQAIAYVELLDRKVDIDLTEAPIEVRIVSTADGCSHLVGPFFHLWWQEHADRPFEQLMADNRRKLHQDWTRKIVLPEARAAFEPRYRLLQEQFGTFPERFLDSQPRDGHAS